MNYSKASLLIILFASFIVSCQKIDSTTIGSGLVPPVDNVNTFDTIVDVFAENVYDTSSVFLSSLDYRSLGRVNNDPVFGKITGIINMEVSPPYYPFYFFGLDTSRTFDSAVLVLSYKGMWGDSTKLQKLNVYEISQTDTLKASIAYSTKYEVKHEPTLLATITVDPRQIRRATPDTLKPYANEIVQNEIRIRITDSAFLRRFLRQYDSAKSSINGAYFNDTTFQKRFRGFAIVPDTTLAESNGLLAISIADQDTKLAFYYKARAHKDSTKKDITATYFTFQSSGTAFQQGDGHTNHIVRNYIGAEINNGYLASGADSLIYIQTRPGVSARVRIPGLDSIKNRVVHRAELILEQAPHSALDVTLAPPYLFLTAYSTDSSTKFMLPSPDVEYNLTEGVTNYATFGGFPFKKTINSVPVKAYNFDLTRYVQGIITRKNRNYPLHIFAPFNDRIPTSELANITTSIVGSGGSVNQVAAGRVRLGGGNHSKYRMRLRIVYSRL